MNIKKLILQNRSYRRFEQKHKIEKDFLLNLVDLARLSPSARNQQALKFYISNETIKNEQIFLQLAWAGYLKDWNAPKEGEKPAAYIVIMADTNIAKADLPSWIYTDLGIACQSILLGAVENELGGCIIAAVNRPKLSEILNLPENLKILSVVALGKPKEEIIIEEIKNNKIKYWRDENEVHHVPKRNLNEIIIN